MNRLARNKIATQEARAGFLFISPHILGFLIFTLGALVASIFLSFCKWDLVSAPKWVGFANYARLIKADSIFWKSLINTLYFTLLYVPLSLIGSLILASLLSQKIRGIGLFRTVYFSPVVCSVVAIAIVWQWIFNRDFGLLNRFLAMLSVPGQNWLGAEKWAMFSVSMMAIWQQLGYNMVIYLAGIQNIPASYYEAADMDGADWWVKFRRITVPLLAPTTFFLTIISVIYSLQVFTQVYVMTKGGPNYATTTIVLYLYQNAFEWHKMGYASAIAWLLFILIFGFTLVQMKFSKKWTTYG